MRNSIDTMYYTRHTQINLRNPFHNDYLRYHPQKSPQQDNITSENSEFAHFIPEMTSNGVKWTDIYTLGNDMVSCHLERSKFPYVYTLKSKDPRVIDGQYAKVCTLEARRYIRVVLNKIHRQREQPTMFWCRPMLENKTNQILGWIPVRHDRT